MKIIKSSELAKHIASVLIGIVFFVNLQAGIDFYFHPEYYAYAYELIGLPGNLVISGFGLLFIMWNVPYGFAIINPFKHKISHIQAIIMQLLGCLGESLLIFRIPENQHLILRSSMMRFVIFDSIGLFLLILAFLIVHYKKQ